MTKARCADEEKEGTVGYRTGLGPSLGAFGFGGENERVPQAKAACHLTKMDAETQSLEHEPENWIPVFRKIMLKAKRTHPVQVNPALLFAMKTSKVRQRSAP